MGPRPFSRGNHTYSHRLRGRLPSFNGATTFQSWKRGISPLLGAKEPLLQWGHDLSVVETTPIRTGCAVDCPASMGPRPFSRGNATSRPYQHLEIPCFNGATTFQSWKRHLRGEGCEDSQRFNGATTFQSWKPVSVVLKSDVGQRFNGATTFQSWKPVSVVLKSDVGHSFNGATTFQSWKLAKSRAIRRKNALASMGPRPFSRGNARSKPSPAQAVVALQWGHDLSVVETWTR